MLSFLAQSQLTEQSTMVRGVGKGSLSPQSQVESTGRTKTTVRHAR